MPRYFPHINSHFSQNFTVGKVFPPMLGNFIIFTSFNFYRFRFPPKESYGRNLREQQCYNFRYLPYHPLMPYRYYYQWYYHSYNYKGNWNFVLFSYFSYSLDVGVNLFNFLFIFLLVVYNVVFCYLYMFLLLHLGNPPTEGYN